MAGSDEQLKLIQRILRLVKKLDPLAKSYLRERFDADGDGD